MVMPSPSTTKTVERQNQRQGECSSCEQSSQIDMAGSYASALRLQRVVGNRAVSQIIQAKLSVSKPGDHFEQEADRVAEQVMRAPDTRITAGAPAFGRVQASCLQRL